MHDGQQRQLVMHRAPQHTGLVIEIAIGLYVDDDAFALACGQRRATAGTGAIAHAAGTLRAQIAVGLVVRPQFAVMTA